MCSTYKHHTFIFNLNLFALFQMFKKCISRRTLARERKIYTLTLNIQVICMPWTVLAKERSVHNRIAHSRLFVRKSISKTSRQQTLSCLEFLVFRTFIAFFFLFSRAVLFLRSVMILKVTDWNCVKVLGFWDEWEENKL